jgi:hypothetical protein
MGSSRKAMADDNRREMLLLLKYGEKTPIQTCRFDIFGPALDRDQVSRHCVLD